MNDWSLTTVHVGGRFEAAVRRADGSLATSALLARYPGLAAMLEDWDSLLPALRDLDADALAPLRGATAVAPLRYPRKIIGGGPNYTDHVAEMGAPPIPPDAAPFFYFVPPSTTVIGDGETVLIPDDPAAKVDWEAELAVVIGRRGRDIPERDAGGHIAGYACFNDVTARGLMRRNPPLAEPFAWDWASCKGLDTFCPLGAMSPAWMVPDPGDLSIRCLVNGVVKQDSSSKNMIRGVFELIAEASRFWTLEPGDVLATGTPAGVGFFTGERLTDGDDLRVEIGNLAPLTNPVRFWTTPLSSAPPSNERGDPLAASTGATAPVPVRGASGMTEISERTESLDEFNARIGQDNMVGQWTFEPILNAAIGGPTPSGTGFVWPWDLTRQRLREASDVLGPAGVGRCNLTFLNPGITQGPPGSTHTISAGMQVMRAQEVCWSHRHSMSALRFVIEGHPEAYTAVDGEALTMGRFDLLLTPRFSWHDHHNPTDQEIVWLDVLDLGLVGALHSAFYETFGEASQPLRKDEAESQGLRVKALRPTWEQPRQNRLPVRYPWARVEEVLAGYGDSVGSPYDGLALSYANPITGGPTLSTMDCWIQQLAVGFDGLRHRRTSSSVGFVLDGRAMIEVEGVELAVGPGDTFAIPNYAWHRFVNEGSDPVRIFSVNDIPAMSALGLFYEEPVAVHHADSAPVVPGVPHKPIYRTQAMLERDETR